MTVPEQRTRQRAFLSTLRVGLLSALWLLGPAHPLFAASSSLPVGVPAGIVRIALPAGPSHTLVSVPFCGADGEALDVNTLLGSQLKDGKVRVWLFDPLAQRYAEVVHTRGSDGGWSLTDGRTAVLPPGSAFILENQGESREVFIAGSVVLNPEITTSLKPGLQLMGYPYSVAAPARQTSLGRILASSSNAAPAVLNPGQGYWYYHPVQGETSLSESRPYADEFARQALPRISGIRACDGALRLTITPSGTAGETVDIYVADTDSGAMPRGGLQTVSETVALPVRPLVERWRLAARDIPVNRRGEIEWEDSFPMRSPGGDGVAVRYYLVGRSDVDDDQDGIPDCRERFVMENGQGPHADQWRAVDVDGNNEEASTNSLQRLMAVARDGRPAQRSPPMMGVIYVDRVTGLDALTGHYAKRFGGDGPKRSLKAARQAVPSGGTLVIQEGTYNETLNARGQDVRIEIRGRVRL